MKTVSKTLAAIIGLLFFVPICKAQNLFPKKLDNCITDQFCLDCGDEKASVHQASFAQMIENLNSSNDFGKISGKIMFQVLIDSLGKGCILSHTDQTNHPITRLIVQRLNEFKGWMPATTAGKAENRTSINLLVEIKNGVLTIQIERVDMQGFKKSFDRPSSPEIYNKKYKYKNEHLSSYSIRVWNSLNSNLSNNFNDHIAIDQNNTVWLTIEEGLVTFDGKSYTRSEQNITDKGKYFGYYALASDNANTKWVYGKDHIYSFDGQKWTMYDSSTIGINSAYRIINNKRTGEVFFCSDNGLTIYKGGHWSHINQNNLKELPSNRVAFAKRDAQNRLWIGTYSGSVLIDQKGKATNFNDTRTVLKGKCITSMDEDESGNIFLGLYEYDRKNPKSANNDEGIAIYDTNGEIKQYTTSNSGMPFNHVTKVLYDQVEKVLWIATDRAGLVRYDLKDGWEHYHNENSAIPTSYIADMAFDQNGTLYLVTRQGLVQIERKDK